MPLTLMARCKGFAPQTTACAAGCGGPPRSVAALLVARDSRRASSSHACGKALWWPLPDRVTADAGVSGRLCEYPPIDGDHCEVAHPSRTLRLHRMPRSDPLE